MAQARHSESVTSIRHESSVHHSTLSYRRETTIHTVQTVSSNTGSSTRNRPGSGSNARMINQRPRHDDHRDRSPRRQGSSSTRYDHNAAGNRNDSTRSQASSGAHHHIHQNPQRPARRSQLVDERSQLVSFVQDTNNIPDTFVGRQYGFQGSNRVHDAQRRIREVEEIFERQVHERRGQGRQTR